MDASQGIGTIPSWPQMATAAPSDTVLAMASFLEKTADRYARGDITPAELESRLRDTATILRGG